ncbi:hypothetical protein IEO21_05160 [Rhodonia placenta]|uniref:tripeptidyl-peptidase II n=1 Tax=Rhodonia placenta TaxID=104341 RepID=A0A8H7U1V8_9APHY|nr:hypothetical protein IEO21_05160 [Postia placenta]
MLSAGLLALSLLVSALGKPVARSLQVHEARATIPSGFVKTAAASPDTVLSLRLALKNSDTDGLIAALYDVSTPSSANYGQHLSKEEVDAFNAPTKESVDAVNAWLSEYGLSATSISPADDWLAISVPVSKANVMFDADFSVFTHESTGKTSVRTLSYSIPTDLVDHLSLVHPTTTFASPTGPKLPITVKQLSTDARKRQVSSCSSNVDPACLEALYGIPTTPATEASNYIVVTGYDDQYPSTSDLENFLGSYQSAESSSASYTVVELDGGSYDPSDPGDEADLDIQYTVGLALGVNVTFFSVGEDTSDGVFGFLDTANYWLGQSTAPSVITTSYGSDESDISVGVFNSLCNAYASLGARGTSVLFASGDGGVSGSQSGSCTDFVPTFPSGCPYVTSVGATQNTGPETAADFSSGGFSNVFGTPSFQSSDVSSYLSYLGTTNQGLYNASGRGFPDVSAQGVDFIIGYEGEFYTVSGTSCASPTFASVIGLVNDRLVAAGKSPLGWLNPFLYSTGKSALTDITSGDNPGCNTNGFTATTGWDPVTGLGTPVFSALLTAAGL